mgnify:CR=1 FL=1
MVSTLGYGDLLLELHLLALEAFWGKCGDPPIRRRFQPSEEKKGGTPPCWDSPSVRLTSSPSRGQSEPQPQGRLHLAGVRAASRGEDVSGEEENGLKASPTPSRVSQEVPKPGGETGVPREHDWGEKAHRPRLGAPRGHRETHLKVLSGGREEKVEGFDRATPERMPPTPCN